MSFESQGRESLSLAILVADNVEIWHPHPQKDFSCIQNHMDHGPLNCLQPHLHIASFHRDSLEEMAKSEQIISLLKRQKVVKGSAFITTMLSLICFTCQQSNSTLL